MPTTNLITPPHQQLLHSQQEEDKRAKQRVKSADEFHNDVEHAHKLHSDAAALEGERDKYDRDGDFRRRVAEDRAAFRNRIAFVATLVLIAVADFTLGTPDPSEWLASKAMAYVPHWLIPPSSSGIIETPVWLRAIAGTILVSLFLAITLRVKKASDESELQAARFEVQPGDHATYSQLNTKIWVRRSLKIAYMAVLALLLFNLYDYDRQRARLIANTVALNKSLEQSARPKLAIGSRPPTTPPGKATPASAGSSDDNGNDSGLAKASAVVFSALFILHGLLLIMPSGFGRDLEYAHFRRPAIVEEAREMRNEEGRLLRSIYRRIRTAPANDQNELIEIAVPVIPRINDIYGRVVIRLPDTENQTTANANGSPPEHPDDVAPQPAPPSDPFPGGPGNNGAAEQIASSAPVSEVNESGGNDSLDFLFPRARRA